MEKFNEILVYLYNINFENKCKIMLETLVNKMIITGDNLLQLKTLFLVWSRCLK